MSDVHDAHTEMPNLAGRKAAITGGTTGIGRAIAVLLASEGVEVFICGRERAHLNDALKRIREVGRGGGIALDLARGKGVEKFFNAAENHLGKLDIAVLNAAIDADTVAEVDARTLNYQIATDFTAYLTSAHAAAERMGAGGDIVMIGSMSAVSRAPGGSVYVAAKAGIEAFAQSLRKELAEHDIKVGLIEPGFTGADFQYPKFGPRKQAQLIRQDKMLRAEDIAVAAHVMLTQPRRAAVSLMRVETRLKHP